MQCQDLQASVLILLQTQQGSSEGDETLWGLMGVEAAEASIRYSFSPSHIKHMHCVEQVLCFSHF